MNYSYFKQLGTVFVAGCTDGNVRLTGGSSEGEGTVEVCSKKTQGMVSGLGWGEKMLVSCVSG